MLVNRKKKRIVIIIKQTHQKNKRQNRVCGSGGVGQGVSNTSVPWKRVKRRLTETSNDCPFPLSGND